MMFRRIIAACLLIIAASLPANAGRIPHGLNFASLGTTGYNGAL